MQADVSNVSLDAWLQLQLLLYWVVLTIIPLKAVLAADASTSSDGCGPILELDITDGSKVQEVTRLLHWALRPASS